MEVFAAFKKSQLNDPDGESQLFSEVTFDCQTSSDDYIFYERNLSLVYSDRAPYTNSKPRIYLQELFNGNKEDLKTKFSSGSHDFPYFIKTYSSPENLMLMNKHIEIIGFLNFPEEFEVIEKSTDIYFQNELDPTLHPYFTPIIHAIHVKPIAPFEEACKGLQEQITKNTSNKMIDFMAAVTKGDRVAGKLLLYSIVSLVTNRPFNSPIDFLSLNLYNLTNDLTLQNIKRAINLLAPLPIFQQITLSDLAKNRLFGKKNYDLNCIEQGIPMEDGTTLVLDETQLEIGTLYEVAVKNVTMLNNVIGLQKRFYDFDYCPFEAECNCTVIGLSRGKSILEFEYKVIMILQGST